MWGALSTASSCHRASWSTSMSTKRYCSVCIVQWMRRGERCGRTTRGCFTMTTHLPTLPWVYESSWPKRTSLCWSNLPTRPTWLHVIFSSSPSSRGSSRKPVLRMCTTSERLWWQSYGESRKNRSRSACKHGREGWESALDSRGITSTGIVCSLDLKYIFCDTSPGTALIYFVEEFVGFGFQRYE